MKHVKKSVLLWYSAHEMYELVCAVGDYPKFLPWCERAEILERHDWGIIARVHLAFAGVRHSFVTKNTHTTDARVLMELVEGPFSHLEGVWNFKPVGALGGTGPQACRVEFDLRYAFSSRALSLVLSPVFDRVANTFVDSFVKRAEQIYGNR